MTVTAVTDANFDNEVLGADMPVLVDYWAEWCGPCKMMSPVLDALATEMGDKVKIVKMNVDENPDIPINEAIRSLPTLAIYRGGKRVATQTGAIPGAALKSFIEQNL